MTQIIRISMPCKISRAKEKIFGHRKKGKKGRTNSFRSYFGNSSTDSATVSNAEDDRKESIWKRKHRDGKRSRNAGGETTSKVVEESSSDDAKAAKEEKKEMKKLKRRLREINKRRKLEIQNIQDWKNEQRWELDRQFVGQQEQEEERKQIENFISERTKKDFLMDHLVKNNDQLHANLAQLERERNATMAENIKLRNDYKRLEQAKMSQKHVARKSKKNQDACELDDAFQSDVPQVQHLNFICVKNKNIQSIFEKALDGIVELLHNRSKDPFLLIDTIVISNKHKKIIEEIKHDPGERYDTKQANTQLLDALAQPDTANSPDYNNNTSGSKDVYDAALGHDRSLFLQWSVLESSGCRGSHSMERKNPNGNGRSYDGHASDSKVEYSFKESSNNWGDDDRSCSTTSRLSIHSTGSGDGGENKDTTGSSKAAFDFNNEHVYMGDDFANEEEEIRMPRQRRQSTNVSKYDMFLSEDSFDEDMEDMDDYY